MLGMGKEGKEREKKEEKGREKKRKRKRKRKYKIKFSSAPLAQNKELIHSHFTFSVR